MNGIAAFLVAMVGPLIARALAALGFSLISVAGLAAAVSTLRDQVLSNAGSIPADGAQLAGLFGLWYVLGMIFGSITFVVAWRATAGFWKVAHTA